MHHFVLNSLFEYAMASIIGLGHAQVQILGRHFVEFRNVSDI